MKVMTVLGTRPEIIRLSQIIPKLDLLCEHVLVHTGQNFDPNLSEIFFYDLNIRPPDHFLGVHGSSFGDQIGQIISATEEIMLSEQPDRLLILGDTNSSLSAIVAKRLGIPVYHMEAGNRCYDDRVPEEVNRRIIDHSSDILLPYTERSRANLLREGIAGECIFVTGNPIYEVLKHYQQFIDASNVLERLHLKPGAYILVTMHRAENVDVESRLCTLLAAMENLHRIYEIPLICSLHPRTRDRMKKFGLLERIPSGLQLHDPFGLFDFIRLEQNARCVLSDSGTVQEECCIFHVPNVTIRDVTERPETIECGSSILSGADLDTIVRAVECVLSQDPDWVVPGDYTAMGVSNKVVKIILGYYQEGKKTIPPN